MSESEVFLLGHKFRSHPAMLPGRLIVLLKHPASNDFAESVLEHPVRREVDVHNLMDSVEFVSDHAKFEQLQII